MNINDLRVFRVVAKKRSISYAAEELNYVQSNVTSRIKRLESEFNVTLFYRHARGVSLTPAGKELLTYTDQIFQLLDRAQKSLQEFSKTPRGELKIGAIDSTSLVRLPKTIASYSKKNPDVEITVSTGTTEQLIHRVLQYELDGAFVVGPVDHSEIVQVPFVTEELVLISSAQHPPISSLSQMNPQTFFALPSGCIYRKKLEKWLADEGISTHIKTFTSLEAILAYVREGLGNCLLSRSFLDYHQFKNQFRIHPVPKRYSQVTTVFIRRKDLFMFKAFREFLKETQESSQKVHSAI
ncbi:DNA-binding transcriptional regulator, LysR family [Melghirimyces thermohalophilus]|uniref:DNA-binding transcriptional regulator, LysR family n=1 Tax=Melghirimyces thermohalophilus TaxID=1236220 RepID=A0A1G6LX27_9BACL|nr:LysR family transcriptional regulator [Melghirimyces thermohalophilus]SDC47822.1 DNA-binding transcriptional regulator, LysR family [Melghirimyces thermohalophilus]